MQLNSISDKFLIESESSDKILIQLINHQYSSLSPQLQKKFTDLLRSGTLPPHNRSYLVNIAKKVQAAISFEDNHTIASGIMIYADSLRYKGVLLALDAKPTDIPQIINRLTNTPQESDPADWWKQEEKSEITGADDFAILARQNNGIDWAENVLASDIVIIKGCYANERKPEYDKTNVIMINNEVFITMGDDKFETDGLMRLLLQNIETNQWAKLPDLKADIEKYGLQII